MTKMTQVLDPPSEFEALTPLEQQSLRLRVRLVLAPAPSFGAEHGRWHSYNLKHHAEKAVGWYVRNGELKGAMLAEGYVYRECEGTGSGPSPNWLFRCRRRCPHRMGQAVLLEYVDDRGKLHKANAYGFTCPGALLCGSLYQRTDHYYGGAASIVTSTYPALCQATAGELAEFNRMRRAAYDEHVARQARRRWEQERQAHTESQVAGDVDKGTTQAD